MNRSTKNRYRAAWAILACVAVTCAAGPLSGDDRLDTTPITVVELKATCDRCSPAATFVEIFFDREVDPVAVAYTVVTEPYVRLMPVNREPGRRILLDGPFAARTEYRVRVPAGLQGADGGQTDREVEITLRTGGGNPNVRMPTEHSVLGASRELPLVLEDIDAARLRLIPLQSSDVVAASGVVGRHPAGRDPVEMLPPALRRRVSTHTIDRALADEDGVMSVDPFALVGGTERPLLAILDAPGVAAVVGTVSRGDIGVLIKVGPESGLVWVTDVAAGTPQANAAVQIREGDRVAFRGRTDREGILRLPDESRLRQDEGNAWSRKPLFAVVEVGSKLEFATERHDTGLESWQFGIPSNYYTGPEAIRGMVTAERGIYRPGETVHLYGVLRRMAPNGRIVPPGGRATVVVSDPDGGQQLRREVRLTAYGTFRVEAPVPAASRLGRWSVSVEKDETTIRSSFEVGEFRANNFEVQLSPAGEAERYEAAIQVPVSARYLYGAPVRGGTVRWNVTQRPHRVRFPSAVGYTFDAEGRYHGGVRVMDDELSLDADGAGTIRLDEAQIRRPNDAQALDLIFEASVTDPGDDEVTARTVQTTIYPRDTLLGVRSDRWVVNAASGWDIDLLTLDTGGRPVAGRDVALTVYQRKWMSAAQSGNGGARTYGHYENVVVQERTVTSRAGATRAHFDLEEGGHYYVEARLGEGPAVSRSIWAYGRGSNYGPSDNNPRMDLVLDRSDYSAGDTARVFAQAPWADSLALVTVEREGVLEARTMRINQATPIEVAVDGRFLPNAFVGVTAMPVGLAGGGPAAGVPFRSGYANLQVDAAARRLSVEVTPDEEVRRPGETATVRVRVRDAGGRPVRAEVTLWAADEGVLALTGYQTPDPFAPVYAQRSHHVKTAMSLSRWMRFDPREWYENEGGGDGGGAAGEGAAFRSRFLSTAFFSRRGVVTGADGTARVRMRLPDNLTRWRVMAAAADRGERFGKGESAIVARKPLQVRPSLPRFLTEGDVVDASFVVDNQTGAAGTAEVSLDVEGARLAGENVRRVEVARDGQAVVRFPLIANAVGDVRVRASVRMGQESDAFERTLEVKPPTSVSTVQLGDGRVDGEASFAFRMPNDLEAGLSELVVTVSPSVFASMERGLESLVAYPHGCVEQTTSRLIPMVLLSDLMSDLGTGGLDGPEHRRRMEEAVRHVLNHQNSDGGFGLWPNSSSEGFLTAYAMWGLMIADGHGYSVPQRNLDRGTAYLRRHMTHGEDMHGQFGTRDIAPFAAFVLAQADERAGRAASATLAEAPDSLSHFGMGLLADALVGAEGARGNALFTTLQSAESAVRAGKVVRERGGRRDVLWVGRDLRATASAVRALVHANRADEAEPLVAGILSQRERDGSWGTTYNNLWAVYALSAYAESVRRGRGTVPVEVKIGGRTVASVRIAPSDRAHRIVIPASALPASGMTGEVSVHSPSGSDVRYSARLRYVVESHAERPANHGFAVERAFFDAESGERVFNPTVGQIVRVRLTIESRQRREQVALVDRLPAGLEAVDTSLETSRRRHEAGGDRWTWTWREIHDDRVTFFADHMSRGTHTAEYIARATRSGEFVRPAASAEAMYDPSVWGRGAIGYVTIRRP